jgi:hypothetical protein
MALVQEGRLDLDAPVSTYLTRWALPESRFDNNKVTVRRLLSHTAGLTDGLGYAGFAPNATVPSLEESLKRPDADPGVSGAIEVGYEPGAEWRYSGGGYAILQLLVEEVSGESFEGFMQRDVPIASASYASFPGTLQDFPFGFFWDGVGHGFPPISSGGNSSSWDHVIYEIGVSIP